MIVLTRSHSGERIAVNPELIERIEETPDTVITLTTGTKYVVQECIEEIAERVQVVKATTLALATRMAEDPELGRTARLHIVHGIEDPESDDSKSDGPDSPDP